RRAGGARRGAVTPLGRAGSRPVTGVGAVRGWVGEARGESRAGVGPQSVDYRCVRGPGDARARARAALPALPGSPFPSPIQTSCTAAANARAERTTGDAPAPSF